MSYTSKAEMIRRYGNTELIELTDRDQLDAIDDDVLNIAISDADSTINASLQGRYDVPLSPIPDVLLLCASVLARANLYKDEQTDLIINDKKEQLDFLQKVRDGEINLGTANGAEVEAEDNAVMFEGGGNVFDRNDDSFI